MAALRVCCRGEPSLKFTKCRISLMICSGRFVTFFLAWCWRTKLRNTLNSVLFFEIIENHVFNLNFFVNFYIFYYIPLHFRKWKNYRIKKILNDFKERDELIFLIRYIIENVSWFSKSKLKLWLYYLNL